MDCGRTRMTWMRDYIGTMNLQNWSQQSNTPFAYVGINNPTLNNCCPMDNTSPCLRKSFSRDAFRDRECISNKRTDWKTSQLKNPKSNDKIKKRSTSCG